MNRLYQAVLLLALSALACSLGGADGSGVEGGGGVPAGQEPGEKPTLPVIAAGDCSANPGPGANLAKCDLTEKNFKEADLSGANLAQAILSDSNFSYANFISANLAGVFASDTNLMNANFTGADLTNADLRACNLINADFTGATTLGVDFSGSNMTGAAINDEQLDQAYSVKDAVLPDGSIGK